jgi:hypothetical protein
MLWRFFRWLRFTPWQPRYRYQILVGTSHASADEAATNAQLRANAAQGEVLDIAADALCCGEGEVGADGTGSAEWNVYVLVRT